MAGLRIINEPTFFFEDTSLPNQSTLSYFDKDLASSRSSTYSEKSSYLWSPTSSINSMPPSSPMLKWHEAESNASKRKWRKRILVATAIATLFIVGRSTWSYLHSVKQDRPHSSSLRTVSEQPAQCLTRNDYIKQKCDPYHLRGTLQVDPTEAANNFWQPFDPTCQATDWMSSLKAAVKTKTISPDISWMKDKTIVLFGSSIDRFLVRDMCSHLGIRHTTIYPSHPAYPQIPERFKLYDPAPISHNVDNVAGVPTLCHVAHLNMSVLSVYHYGLESKDDLISSMLMEKKQYHPPAFIHDRFDYIVMPLLANLGRNIDLMQFASFLWDVQYLHRRDKLSSGAYPDSVQPKDVTIYGDRLEQTLERIASKIPEHVPIVWRTPHYIKASSDAFLPPRVAVALKAMSESVIEKLSGTLWHQVSDMADFYKRHSCIDAAAKLANRVRPSQFGSVIKGFEHLQRDDIHPGLNQNWVGANVLLHELWKSV